MQNSPFIHATSEVFSKNIGSGTSIWQFCVVLEGAVIGTNCNINSQCFIENDVVIGNNVTVKSGIYIWDKIHIEDDVFLGPNVVFTNDLRPRSKRRVPYAATLIKQGASIGANSTILAGVTIGRYAMSGIGSVITRDVPDYALVYGNPAKIKGWVDEDGNKLTAKPNNQFVNDEGDKFQLTKDGLIRL